MTDTEQLARIRDILRPLLGKEPCPNNTEEGICARDSCCGLCSGTSTRDVIDGMGTVEAVQRLTERCTAAEAIVEDAEDAMRHLAFTLSAGGYNSPTFDVVVFEKKINDGIDWIQKAMQNRINELTASRDAARAAVAEMRERAAKVCEAEAEMRRQRERTFFRDGAEFDGRIQGHKGVTASALAAAIRALPLTTDREQELEALTERWHAGEFGDKQLHEVFGMTWEEYGKWLQPKTLTTEEK